MGAHSEGTLGSAQDLSPQETLSQARTELNYMETTLGRISRNQEAAKRRKDLILLNCINEKFREVKSHLAVAGQAMANLNVAIARQDDSTRQEEFMRVNILYQKVLVLGTEAENCAGADLTYVGDTVVTVDVDPSIPQQDPTAFQFPTTDTSRPPQASPTL
jgi:hypothetical protein